MKKLVVILTIVTICIGIFATLSFAKDQLVVAFSQCDNQNNWKINETNSIKEEAQKRGIKLIYTDASADTAKQVADIEDIVSQNPDYIIISPRVSAGLTYGLEQAKKAGIPVIIVDCASDGIPGEDFVTFIHGDFVWEGREAAKSLARRFTGLECNIVEIVGAPASAVTADRQKGFMDEIKKYPNMKVIASQVGDYNRITAQKAMENIIQAHGDEIDAVFGHNDDNSIGALMALKAAGYKPGKDVIIVGIDGQKDALKAIINGEMLSTVLCSSWYGPPSFDVIEMLEKGEKVATSITNPGKLYDITNAEESLKEAF